MLISQQKEMVIHAEPVDTADVTHFFFCHFFIGSGSVLAILIKKQVASGEIMGSQPVERTCSHGR